MFRENSTEDPRSCTAAVQDSRSVDFPRQPAIAPRLLSDLSLGQRIRLVPESVPESHRPLLEAMGLCNGCDLHLCQSSGTCILDIAGSRVGISEQVAGSILAIPVTS